MKSHVMRVNGTLIPRSVIEASKDGYRTYLVHENQFDDSGHWEFERECVYCKRPVRYQKYYKNKIVVCKRCQDLRRRYESVYDKALQQALIDIGAIDQNKVRFDKAVLELKTRVKGDFPKYQHAIELAETRCEKYASIPEAMVAIQLIHDGHKIIPQQKIGGYHVDFALPEEKIIIEVDGGRYHDTEDIGGLRDMILKECFGDGTKVIHIPAEYIRKNIKRLDTLMRNYRDPWKR